MRETLRAIVCPNLYTERLLLRPFEMGDAMAMFGWACDPEVTRYLRFHVHEDISESKRVISHWIDQMKNPPFFHWALTLRETGQVFGSMGIEVINKTDRSGEVGYCLSKHMWNKGYASEALRAVLHFAFNTAAFHRIQGCHAIDNPASGKVMEKAGMVREAGPLRHWYYSDILGYLDSNMLVAFSDTWRDSDR